MSSPESTSEKINPTRPAAGYIGGKRCLAKRLTARIQATPHTAYAEPFVGMGGIFLRRPERMRREYINDYSRDVATFFRVLQRHYVAFLDMLRFQLTSRVGFDRLLATDPDTMTDLERAARFLYLQRLSYGGKVAKRQFGVDPGGPGRFDLTRLTPLLEDIHERLSAVVIECLPWQNFVTRYDRPDMLFYLDPPYFGNESDYGKSSDGQPLFTREQFVEMAHMLSAIKGRFILSINDHPEIRELFSFAHIETADTSYSVGGKGRFKPVSELIISTPS